MLQITTSVRIRLSLSLLLLLLHLLNQVSKHGLGVLGEQRPHVYALRANSKCKIARPHCLVGDRALGRVWNTSFVRKRSFSRRLVYSFLAV